MLTETLLYRTVTMDYYGHYYIQIVPNTDIHKRGVLERIVEPPL